ncbi:MULTISPECIES: hypothetical protein [Rhizobium]|uniref:hypothetical protein n=1 Tax=Rhizobium TaxID=379 RepID=UPI002DDCD53F|nr:MULTISPECIES: hypothetical protein [Rhizobium]WSG78374.1 hypothetical protein U8P80_34950 [Rhizobium beringeri]WSG92352.1 hypothetical protein U8P73_29030 [Rhizobium beringeri]WSH18569.1 hypothetical protein U8P74_34950 [Rhizobium beringeri]WSH29572.1 hypothetical protein U8P75_24355 [Rhizobium beringeri]WSH48465.1 hypothetical protein U8P77_32835 [Rhizobium johnstonii]
MCRIYPTWAVTTFVALLFSANTINIGGDLAAMGEAAELVPVRAARYSHCWSR